MSEITDQLAATIQSQPFLTAVGKLSEEQATAFGAVVMSVMRGEPIQQKQQGPRILSEQEFLALSPEQLRRLDKYDEYVARKMEQAATAQQAAGMSAEMESASKRLDDMREQMRQSWQARQATREQWLAKIVNKAAVN